MDEKQFTEQAARLGKIKHLSAPEMLTYLGKIYVRYLMQFTPPVNKHPGGQNVWAEQKKIGEAAMGRDIRKGFQPFSVAALRRYVKIPRHASKSLNDYAKAGLIGKLKTLLQRLHFPVDRVSIIRFVDYERARRNTDFSRSPHKPKNLYFVIDAASITKTIAEGKKHIGKAKAGWIPGATRLGYTGAPQWVKRHAGAASGDIIDNRSKIINPEIIMRNSTVGAAAENYDVVAAAMRELQRSGIEKQLAGVWNKNNRRR